jgi:hypothetical protein
VILPSLTSIAGGYFGYRVAVTQSNNATTAQISNNDMMTATTLAGYSAIGGFKPVPIDFAGLIQSLPPTQVVTIGGDGVVSGGTITKPVTCTSGVATTTSGTNNC